MRAPRVSAARQKRVVLVIGSLEIGGTERHVAEIAPALVRRGYQVSVFCLTHGGVLAGELEAAGVEVIPPGAAASRLKKRDRAAKGLAWILVGVQLLGTLIRRRPALVQCFLPAGNIAGAYAARLAFVPVVITSRRSMNLYQRNQPIFSRIERFGYNFAHAVVANSQAAARELTDIERVPAARVRVIRNGLDLEKFESPTGRDAARRALGLDAGTIAFVISANLKAYKAHVVLIEALQKNVGRLPDWVLLAAGRDDGEGAAIMDRCTAAGFADRVRLLGARRDVPVLLRAADIGVLCSREEGLPNAIIEYMAAGLPVVTTAAGGAAEIVIEGETGFVVPVDDSAALGDKLERLAADAELRARLGMAGRARAAKFFSLESCVDSYVALYKEFGINA